MLMENFTSSDSSVKQYTGFPSKHLLIGTFEILDANLGKLNYRKGQNSGQKKDQSNRKPDLTKGRRPWR